MASTAEAAFAEALPYGRENLPETPLSDLFDDAEDGEEDVTLASKVARELPVQPMRNTVSRGWRVRRTLYQLRLPRTGWFVDVNAAESLSVINATFTPPDDDRLTLADLTGEARNLTTDIAGWVRNLVLDDGSVAHGIKYISKWGANLDVYAVWLRALDDGKSATSEPTKVISQETIPVNHRALVKAAEWNGLRAM